MVCKELGGQQMRAEMEDMPEYLKNRKQESPWRMVAMMVIGTGIVVGGLSLFGGGLTERAKTIASGQNLKDEIGLLQPQPKQQELARPQNATTRRESYGSLQPFRDNDNVLIIDRGAIPEEAPAQQARQTIFNDQNYRPQGAVNVVNFSAPTIPKEQQQSTQLKQKEIVVVGKEETRLRDFCPYKPGTIEHRNCRMRMDLNSRKRN